MFFTWNFNCLIAHSFLLIRYNTDKIINFFLHGHFWLTQNKMNYTVYTENEFGL